MNKQIILVFVILVAIIALLWWTFSNISHEILLGLFVGLMPLWVMWYRQNRKDEKEHHNWLLRNKEAYLAEIVDAFVALSQDTKNDEKEKYAKLLQRLKHLQSAVLVWGSPSFLRAWDELKRPSSGGDTLKNATKKGERFFRVIRKELGHDDSSLDPGEISATLLKPEEKQKILDICRGESYK